MNSVNVPALKIDQLLYRDGKIPAHGKLERRIVANLLAHIRAAGFPAYSVHDGDEETAVKTDKDAMELLFNLDDAHVFVQKEGGKPHWIRLVFGNGEDLVSDYSYSTGDPDGWQAVMDAFDAEDYA